MAHIVYSTGLPIHPLTVALNPNQHCLFPDIPTYSTACPIQVVLTTHWPDPVCGEDIGEASGEKRPRSIINEEFRAANSRAVDDQVLFYL